MTELNRPKFFMMVGLPASGKSYMAMELSEKYDAAIVSSDSIRFDYFGDTSFQGDNKAVFDIVYKQVKEHLRANKNVICDATNISYKKRMHFLKELKNIPCEKTCIFMATAYDICLARNKDRARCVPEAVIKRMYMNFYIPQKYEGWDNIVVIRNPFNIQDIQTLFAGLKEYSQHNHNHELTVGDHCLECAYNVLRIRTQNGKNIENYPIPSILWQAALYHDIGKPFVQTFVNSKGEETEDAHYYQHHLVSAYNSIFYLKHEDILPVSNYIQWHMQPYWLEKEKTVDKYKALWGEEFYSDIMILNAADRLAKKRGV